MQMLCHLGNNQLYMYMYSYHVMFTECDLMHPIVTFCAFNMCADAGHLLAFCAVHAFFCVTFCAVQ